ncbi:hypothetical protein QUC31_019697 [Theobroma cacao]
MQKDVKIYVGVEWIFLLIIAVASSFLAISTTHASALIHGGKKISFKDLVLRTARSLKRPFVTCFYITLFGLSDIFLCLVTLLPLVLILGSEVTSSVFAILLSISAMVFYTYLSVVWNLSLLISVLEEPFGIEALGKAAQTVKGMKLQGFILNLLLTILPLILLQCLRSIMLKQSVAILIVITLLLLNSIWMVRMFGHTSYTVLHYQCKKTDGEEVELQADMEYTKIPTVPLISENIP